MSVYAWYGLGVGLGVAVHLVLSRTRAPVWLRWVAPAPFAAAIVALLAIYSEPPPRQLFEDFHEAYLFAARTVLRDPSRLYQGYSHGFVNIPVVALPFIPLAMLTPKDAQQVYLLLGLVVVGTTWAAQKRLLQAPQEVALVLAALFLINGPLYNSLREGNSTHLLGGPSGTAGGARVPGGGVARRLRSGQAPASAAGCPLRTPQALASRDGLRRRSGRTRGLVPVDLRARAPPGLVEPHHCPVVRKAGRRLQRAVHRRVPGPGSDRGASSARLGSDPGARLRVHGPALALHRRLHRCGRLGVLARRGSAKPAQLADRALRRAVPGPAGEPDLLDPLLPAAAASAGAVPG